MPDTGDKGFPDIEDSATDSGYDTAWVYAAAHKFAAHVLDAEDSRAIAHYAEWITARVLAAGGSEAFNPIHSDQMKIWASQGHGPDWLRPCTPPKEGN